MSIKMYFKCLAGTDAASQSLKHLLKSSLQSAAICTIGGITKKEASKMRNT
jgi:hypothetical protein